MIGVLVVALSTLIFGQIRDESVASLVSQLGKPNSEMALAELILKGSEGERALIGQANNPDPVVRARVAGALLSTFNARSLDVVASLVSDADWQVSKAAMNVLKAAGSRAVGPIERHIGSATQPVSTFMIWLITPKTADGERHFEEILRGGSLTARERTIGSVGNLFFPTRSDLFHQVLNDPSPRIRAALIESLTRGELSNEEVPFVRSLLSSRDAKVRLKGLDALQHARQIPSGDILRLTRDPDAAVKAEAVKTIAYLPVSASVAASEVSLLDDRDPAVREAVLVSLWRRVDRIASGSNRRSDADATLVKLFEFVDIYRLRERLYQMLATSHSLLVGELLGYVGDSRAYPFLFQKLKADAEPRGSRGEASIPVALAYADGIRAAQDLVPFLHDPHHSVVEALGYTKSQAAIPPLRQLLNSSHTDVSASDSLVSLGDRKALPIFIEIAHETSLKVYQRGNILFRIGELGGPGAVDTLLDVLDDSSLARIHWQAEAGMKALTDPEAIPDLRRAVQERKGESAKQAAAALDRLTRSNQNLSRR
ncbi:MAG TPA: hypothetical protein VG944_13675 [Fimbriimonas sp.]|nr:hypothetical protein [Fimbriimonas sp.]